MDKVLFVRFLMTVIFAGMIFVSCNDARRSSGGDGMVKTDDSTMVDVPNYHVHKIFVGSEITNMPVSSQLVEIKGKEKYLLMDRGFIYIFDWETGKMEDSVATKNCGKLQNYSGFTYISADTILVYNSAENILFMLDSVGKVRDRWLVPRYDDFKENPLPTIEALNGTRPELLAGRIMLSGPILGNMSQAKGLRVPVSETIDTETGQWRNVAFYPEVYSDENLGSQYMNAFSVAKDDSGRVIFSYAALDKVLRYKADFSSCDTLLMKSRYDKGIVPCDLSPEEFDADPNEEIRYYINQPTYSGVMYDKYRKVYLRIAEHAFSGWDGKESFAKPFSIIVADKDGMIISESSVVKDRLLFNRKNMHIGKEGLIVSMRNADENNLYFACFEIKTK